MALSGSLSKLQRKKVSLMEVDQLEKVDEIISRIEQGRYVSNHYIVN